MFPIMQPMMVPTVLFTGLVQVGGILDHFTVVRTTRARHTVVEVEGIGEFSPEGELRRCYLSQDGESTEELLAVATKLVEEVA
jgi:hypothetical protein